MEKKVPLNNKCRLEVLDVVTILYPNSPKLCESPVPIRENKHVPPWKSTFHVFWSQMMVSIAWCFTLTPGKTAFPTEPGEAVGGHHVKHRIQCTNQN